MMAPEEGETIGTREYHTGMGVWRFCCGLCPWRSTNRLTAEAADVAGVAHIESVHGLSVAP